MRSTRVGGFHGGLGTEGKAPVGGGGGGGAFLGVSGAPLCCAGVVCRLVFVKKGGGGFLGASGAVLGRGTVLGRWFTGGGGLERGGDVNKDQPAGRVHTGRVCSFGCG